MKTILSFLLLSGSLAFCQVFSFADPAFVAGLSGVNVPVNTNPVVLFHFDNTGSVATFREEITSNTFSNAYGFADAAGITGRITNGLFTAQTGFHGLIQPGIWFKDFTFSVWIKYTNVEEGYKTLISTGWGNPDYPGSLSAFLLWADSGVLYLASGGAGGLSPTIGTLINNANWNHYAYTYTAATGLGAFYTNGVLMEANSVADPGTDFQNAVTWNYFSVGCTDDGNEGQMFNNGLDDLALFTSPLSAGRIAEIYSNGTNGIPVSP